MPNLLQSSKFCSTVFQAVCLKANLIRCLQQIYSKLLPASTRLKLQSTVVFTKLLICLRTCSDTTRPALEGYYRKFASKLSSICCGKKVYHIDQNCASIK